MFVLFTDTDCDMSPELASKYGYNLIYMPYNIEDKDYLPYKEDKDFTFEVFYNKLKEGIMPTTYSVNIEEYKNYFEPFLKEGKDILYIHLSTLMSGTVNNCAMAVKELKEEYPGRRIELVDTCAISIGALEILIEASKLYKDNKTMDEIIKFVEEERNHFACYFFSEDLKYFQRSGRLSGLSATIGGIFGVRPIISMTEDGKLTVCDKAIGREKAVQKIFEYMEETKADDMDKYPIYIAHGGQAELSLIIKDKIIEKYGDLDIRIIDINRTIGSHTGPTTIGFAYRSTRR